MGKLLEPCLGTQWVLCECLWVDGATGKGCLSLEVLSGSRCLENSGWGVSSPLPCLGCGSGRPVGGCPGVQKPPLTVFAKHGTQSVGSYRVQGIMGLPPKTDGAGESQDPEPRELCSGRLHLGLCFLPHPRLLLRWCCCSLALLSA